MPNETETHYFETEGVPNIRVQLTQALAKRYEYAGLLRELLKKPPTSGAGQGGPICGLCGEYGHTTDCWIARTTKALEGAENPERKE